jgi:endonuclease-3
MASKAETKDKILEYYEQVLKKLPQKFTNNKEADAFIKQEPLAFLFAVILDQGAIAERIWEIPYNLKRIMGHLDAHTIACMGEAKIQGVFEKLPSKPRYWRTASKRIRNASIQVVNRYQGKAENIWNDNPKAGDLQARLDNFEGVGQKKASMATRILGMDLNVPIHNWNEMDVSVDVMIERVFSRAGLSNTRNPSEIIEQARQLNPPFPGALDLPCWDIGRRWCLPQHPNCRECYISNVCPKIGINV